MSFLNYFRAQTKTAALAKERLQIIVAHERSQRDGYNKPLDYLPLLQKELLEVVRKYVVVEDEHIKIHVEKEGDYERLEVNITLPESASRQQKDD
jgi:cell division topological specificity factor